jgi:uncharacterized protein YjbJ (UPF0337 family)
MTHWFVIARTARHPAGILTIEYYFQETSMNKDQVKGRIKEAKGEAKTVTGKILDDESLTAKGKVERASGKIQKVYGDLKEDLKDVS